MTTYKLLQRGNTCRIVRGSNRIVGSITFVNGKWHGRLRVQDGDALTASGDSPTAVFDRLIDLRTEVTK